MPTKTKEAMQDPAPIKPTLSMLDLGALLVKHYGLHEGVYNVAIEFQIGTGAVGPDKSNLSPGVIIGVKSIGLVQSKTEGPFTVDAGAVNPAKKTRKKAAV